MQKTALRDMIPPWFGSISLQRGPELPRAMSCEYHERGCLLRRGRHLAHGEEIGLWPGGESQEAGHFRRRMGARPGSRGGLAGKRESTAL
jgi:hypothetical protein